jgi:hypothetical protein
LPHGFMAGHRCSDGARRTAGARDLIAH